MGDTSVLFTPTNYMGQDAVGRDTVRVLNNLETTRVHSKCFCCVLEQRKIKERL